EAKLSYLGHTFVENRDGLIAAAMTPRADGRAERDAALPLLYQLSRKRGGRPTTGAVKAYDTRDFVSTVRELGVRRTWPAASSAPSTNKPAGIGYAITLSKRWSVEKSFASLKQIDPLKNVKLRRLAKV